MNGGRIRGGRVADTAVVYLSFLLLSCLQAPGLIAPDTKHDLVVDPVGFLGRATHLWTGLSFSGQVSNQAYGYLFPQGPFFALAHLVGTPAWFTERLWWALVLTVAFTGLVRVAAALRIGTRGSRVVGGVLYALAPRMLGDLTSISSESWVVALAPWVLLPVVRGLRGQMTPRRAGAGAALALALMGAVNAVATAMACLPAVLWFLLHRPGRTWARVAAWWVPLSVLVSLWWAVPLVLLGRVAPPFLDHIESSSVTTRWSSTTEVLRGATSWVPFVSTDRAGAVLVSEPVFVLATGVVAAAGLVGLLHGAMPARGRLSVIAACGLLLMSAPWVGPVDGGFAETLRGLLDGPGAPLRNLHKAEPLLRLPLVLGAVHLTALAWRRLPVDAGHPVRSRLRAIGRPERDPVLALSLVVVLAAGVSLAPAWQLRMVTDAAYPEVPDYWRQAADWLAANATVPPPGTPVRSDGDSDPTSGGATGRAVDTDPDGDRPAHDPAATARALVVPGASFGRQVWGLTRDEPLQPLATTPWAVRDAVPLQPAPAIRALDAVQRLLADGRPAPGLAATLSGLGVGYLVVRNDLAAESGAPRPLLVHQSLDNSPGLVRTATFGPVVGGRVDRDGDTEVVRDLGLRPGYPAVEIYRVDARLGSDARLPGPPRTATAPYLVDLADLPVVSGGPEVLSRLDALAAAHGTVDSPARITRLLTADARAAGVDPATDPLAGPRPLPDGPVLTDTPVDRETDMGRLDHHSSAARDDRARRRGRGAVADYSASVGDPSRPSAAQVPRAHGDWVGARLTASSSASDVDQPGDVLPGHSPAAAVDGDPETSWRSGGFGSGFGQWLQVDLPGPRDRLLLELTVPETTDGPAVTRVEVRTDTGTTTAQPIPGKRTSIPLPPGASTGVRITATGFADGSRGNHFAIAELGLRSGEERIPLGHRLALPPADTDEAPAGWLLTQELAGRAECVVTGPRVEGEAGGYEEAGAVRCAPGLRIDAEEPGIFRRLLQVPAATTVVPDLLVRPRPGPALDEVLRGTPPTRSRQVRASADAAVTDPRGSAAAAVDGDRATSWYAATDAPSPSLRLQLPGRHLVEALRIWSPRARIPAAPRTITVDTGLQRTTVDLSALPVGADGSQLVPVPADYTDSVVVRVDSAQPVRSEPGTGTVPVGMAEVWVLDDAGARIGALPAAGDDGIELGCADGPRVRIGDTEVRTRLHTTRSELLTGRSIRATVCGPGEVDLSAADGSAELTVDPGQAFTVDTLALTATGDQGDRRGPVVLGGADQPTRAVGVGQWDDDRRTVDVPPSPRTRVLVVPESVSAAWSARLIGPKGGELPAPRPLTVDGWKQGWVIPASADPATLVLDVPLDRPYRMALLSGIPALLLVVLVFLLPGVDRGGSRARPWRRHGLVVWIGTVAVAWSLAGVTGVATTATVTVAALLLTRRRGPARVRALLVGGAASGVLGGVVLLSRAPWPDPLGYAGDDAGPQIATVFGLVCAGLAAAWPGARESARRASARSRACRAGSSTSA